MITWRKWFVRGLTFAILLSVGSGFYVYEHYTNPVEVRRQVLARLEEQFPGANVKLDSAHLRLLGGISVSELRLCRKGDPDETEFLHVPTAVLYHDKENLLDGGEFRILKLELQRPRIRLLRAADGTWNMSGVLGPTNLEAAVPTLVITQGTLILEDHRLREGAPPLEIHNVSLTMVNDPISTMTITGSGTCDVLGEVQLTGTLHRATGEIALNIEADSIPVGPELIERLYPFAPDLVADARFLEGTGELKAHICYQPDSNGVLTHDIHFHLTHGKFRHAKLPMPLDNIDATVSVLNGQVTLEQCTAHSGDTTVKLKFNDLLLGGERRWEERFHSLEATVERLPLTREIMKQADLDEVWKDFGPNGCVNLTLTICRGKDGWKKTCKVEPLSIKALPAKEIFRFPVDDITGTIEHEAGAGAIDHCKIDLVGKAAGKTVSMQGTVKGVTPDHEVDLSLWGDNLEITKELLEALPEHYQELARSFKPTGKGNFQTRLTRDPHTKAYRHLIQLHDCTICYAKFPYPLQNVALTLDLLPDHWEVRDFKGEHKGGQFVARGGSFPVDKETDRVVLQIDGTQVELDSELEKALIDRGVREAYTMFDPHGKLDFASTVSFDVRKPDAAATVTDSQHEPVPDIDIVRFALPMAGSPWTTSGRTMALPSGRSRARTRI
jgi:hypothetical protein